MTEAQKTRACLDQTHRKHLLKALNAYLDSGDADMDEAHDLFRAVSDADVIEFAPAPVQGSSPEGIAPGAVIGS